MRCAVLAALLSLSNAALAVDWSGEFRARYETLDGQFRAGGQGGDQVLAIRSLLRADVAATKRVSGVVEVMDSRAYLDDAGTPRSTSLINSHDVLQAYVSVNLADGELKVGRMTLDIASRRFAERNDFRNTINAFTGLHWRSAGGAIAWDLFYVAPVLKRVRAQDGLDANRHDWDREADRQRFWGAHGRLASDGGVELDVFTYGYREWDRGGRQTFDRRYVTSGFRWARPAREGRWDFELEAAGRWGGRSESVLPGAERQSVLASMWHLDIGYQWAGANKLRASVEWDYASGDRGSSGRYERYDRLFGTRRGDLGNTSIHGPLTRSNISAWGLKVEFKRPRIDGRLSLKQVELAEADDTWIVARHQDLRGESGREIGHTMDFRVRYWVMRSAETGWRVEAGGSLLRLGNFGRDLSGGPEADTTAYAYFQSTWSF